MFNKLRVFWGSKKWFFFCFDMYGVLKEVFSSLLLSYDVVYRCVIKEENDM